MQWPAQQLPDFRGDPRAGVLGKGLVRQVAGLGSKPTAPLGDPPSWPAVSFPGLVVVLETAGCGASLFGGGGGAG